MNGIDPGAVGQQFLAYFGGPGGAYISAAAITVVYILCALHMMDRRAGWFTCSAVMGAWIGSWFVRLIGWV